MLPVGPDLGVIWLKVRLKQHFRISALRAFLLSVALESTQKAQCSGGERGLKRRREEGREKEAGERIEMGTVGLFMSASKDQVKFLQLTPGSLLCPGSMPHSCSRAGTHSSLTREAIDEGITVSSEWHVEHMAEVTLAWAKI